MLITGKQIKSIPASKIETDSDAQFVSQTEKNTWSGKASKDIATKSVNGLMSSSDKTKLDGIAAGANNYSHPTTSGNKHIPSGGSSGQILRWSADGTAEWGNDNNTTYNVATASADGLMAKADKSKLDGIATGANKYVHPTTSGNKHIPSGGVTGQFLKWSADGTAVWADNDISYDVATSSTDGLMSSGDKVKLDGIATGANKYVHPTGAGNNHIPAGGVAGQFLKWSADGTAVWANDNNTTYSPATTSANGLMSSSDKTKLDGIATGANKYVHPTGAGNNHIPSGGVAGQFLKWSSDGTAVWANDNNTTYSPATTTTNGLMSSSDKSKLDGIATGANKYVHPTGAGNNHIPSGGASGQYLKWSASGTATWATISIPVIKVGSGTFNSITPVTIQIGATLPNTNYHVSITPTENPDGTLGEIYVTDRTTTSFNVAVTGSFTGSFSWMVASV